MITYTYTHSATTENTGFFSCIPTPRPELFAALRYVASHPHDDFMRRDVLMRIAVETKGLAPHERNAALREKIAVLTSGAGEEAVLRNLSPEEALFLEKLLLQDECAAIPETDERKTWLDMLERNMLGHAKLLSGSEAHLPSFNFSDQSDAFTAPQNTTVEMLFASHAAQISGNVEKSRCSDVSNKQNQAEALTALADEAEERLIRADIIAGPQMRHIASLSPVALLRDWNLSMRVKHGRHDFVLQGKATTYGRGFSVPEARVSCLMEMVERASAYISVEENSLSGYDESAALVTGTRREILDAHGKAIALADYPLPKPYSGEALVWVAGFSHSGEGRETVYVPLQMAGLFSNLDEISLDEAAGSTGLGAGTSMEGAMLSALLEVFERDAEATTPFDKSTCFTVTASPQDDPLINALLADYRARGIHVQFQDITGPWGVPAYKCFLLTAKGRIISGYGAHLDARRALLSALTETPYPYPEGGPSGPLLRKLPVKSLGELPSYDLGSAKHNLTLLEDVLRCNGKMPVYVNLTRRNLGYPVVRCLVPGMETGTNWGNTSRIPYRLYDNYRSLITGERL